jgi:hypothetical protein
MSQASSRLALLAAIAVAPHLVRAQINPVVVKPPVRGGPADANCPPTADDGSKLAPNAKLGDKDASGHNDGTLDYFMGSWTFTDKLGNDVKVVKWCINRGTPGKTPAGAFVYHDYFAFEILTSKAADITKDNPGGETQKVKPGRASQT